MSIGIPILGVLDCVTTRRGDRPSTRKVPLRQSRSHVTTMLTGRLSDWVTNSDLDPLASWRQYYRVGLMVYNALGYQCYLNSFV